MIEILCQLQFRCVIIPKCVEKWPKMSKTWGILHRDSWTFRQLNPEYNTTLWSGNDIEEFIAKEYSWFLSTYKNYPYRISQTDAARFFILHHYGGVYLDLDTECNVPFRDIVKVNKTQDAILAATKPFGITTVFIATKPGDTVIQHIVAGLLEASAGYYVVPYMTVMFTAGPLYVWKRYNSYPCKERVLVISADQFKTFFSHQSASTWHNWDGALAVWMDHHQWTTIYGIMLVFIVSILGILRCGVKLYKQKVQEKTRCTLNF